MPLDEFLRKTLEEAFALTEATFAPVDAKRKKKIILSTFTQLSSVVPASFLRVLQTAKDPKAIVEKMFAKMQGFPPPYQIQVEAGDLDKEHILEEVAVHTVHHIIALIFIAPPESSEYSPFMQDIKELHDFLRQKRASSIVERESAANGEDIGGVPIDLGPDDKTKLITTYARSFVSIPALIKKVADRDESIGQYL